VFGTGVKEIDANVEAKTVVVEADDSVTPEFMLEKLLKVSQSVALILFPQLFDYGFS
jgi:hypothetical protein